jgi:hypothetical protein
MRQSDLQHLSPSSSIQFYLSFVDLPYNIQLELINLTGNLTHRVTVKSRLIMLLD